MAVTGAGTGRFFPMPRGDRAYVLVLLAFAAIAFMPWTRGVQLAGMSLFGWLMAVLMVLSPTIAFARLWRGRRRARPEPSR